MGNEYWAYSGIGKLYNEPIDVNNPNALLPGYARIHYFRPDGNYSNWSVYAFADTAEYTGDFNDGLTFVTSTDSYGAYFDIKLAPNPHDLGFIVHNTSTGVKDPGPDMHLNVGTFTQAWVISGNATVFTTVPTPEEILASLLNVEQAYWLDRQRVAIQPQFAQSGYTYALSYSLTGGLSVTPTGITGGTNIALTTGGSPHSRRAPPLPAARELHRPDHPPEHPALPAPDRPQRPARLLHSQLQRSTHLRHRHPVRRSPRRPLLLSRQTRRRLPSRRRPRMARLVRRR